ncbi:DUF1634 domain-containing protein [Acinetobacter sp. NIPH 2699]|uniref:DUF1634 domain-containing protein n=1 Tax=Acinetobacter sp. NIPH 2699 TaxID=2923433 RepID=UPI001F4A5D87|nr:DUF1634 domain-containing protein [Acinetobacter sp. NIPH 2699]MCH7335016.1 DUF1634 domain-containing protein [Acinetobacter sp. NIPH 2699]
MMLFALLLIGLGMALLYKSSDKGLRKAKPNAQQLIQRFRSQLRLFAFLCFFLAGALLCLIYGSSIGFIGWWIFATPVTFFLILAVNDLSKQPSKKS